jgi:UDP-2,3-diacylglucosamine pyrophosphatase LpxH
MLKYKSVFISDIHLGTKMSQAGQLLDFLKTFECENLYLVGDVIDGWALSRKKYWPQQHNDVIQKILRKARKNIKVIYIPGNHDEFLREYVDTNFGNINILKNDIYEAADGKKYIVMHGDEFDAIVNNIKWLSYFGAWAYDLSMRFNVFVTKIRNWFGLPYWSMSAWMKYKVKSAVNFIGNYEKNLTNYARTKDVDGIICGHIHHANIRNIDDIMYMNCGDWVESCTALVEHLDGTWEIIKWKNENINSNRRMETTN